MDNDSQAKGAGFLGDRFRSCPSCGELIRFGENRCRFCGAPIGPSERGADYPESVLTLNAEGDQAHVNPDAAVVIPLKPTAASPAPSVRRKKCPTEICCTAAGEIIPPEYPAGFNPLSFSFPALFFADLWHAEKGLLPRAFMHYLLRMVVWISGSIAVVKSIEAGMSTEGSVDMSSPGWIAVGFASAFQILAFIPDLILSFTDATSAHRRLTDLVNFLGPDNYERIRRKGVALFWAMLYVPFIVFLLIFIQVASNG